jgi:uracil-DNA glycosylase
VYGYGDVGADFHVIGDHPARHGGLETGVPFTDSVAGTELQSVLYETDFARTDYRDEPWLENVYLSYYHPCDTGGADPTDREYDDTERFLDAELRAINAHILLPVGRKPIEYVFYQHTSKYDRLPEDPESLHAQQIIGRGFMVIPVRDPVEWTDADRQAMIDTLLDVLASDYRQTKGIPTLVG